MSGLKYLFFGFSAILAIEACQDKSTMCPSWAMYGFCTDPNYKSIMRVTCEKSCGVCKAPVTCGKPEIQQGRVIAGDNAKKGAWPWQILMTHDGHPVCGGSLIAPNWVATAAHCVYGKQYYPYRFKIRVGEHITNTVSDGTHHDIGVEKIILSPYYNPRTLNNDIALMKLKTPVVFGKYVKPVCLPNQDQNVPVGTQCYITGWGKIQHPGGMHHTLQQAKMPVVSNPVCSSVNTRTMGVSITSSMLCAGHGGTTRISGCHGDSGGPFVCKTGANGGWVLHGVVSWGSSQCDAAKAYTVFARVSKFKSWIDQQISMN